MGPERAQRISPLKSALKRGIKFTLHSDCPVTPVSPLFCVFAAVNRITRNGEVLGPEFRLTPEEALRAVTLDAAWQTFDEKIKGSIEAGKLADFTILSENPLSVAPEKIKDIQVKEVIMGGKSVYKATYGPLEDSLAPAGGKETGDGKGQRNFIDIKTSNILCHYA
jgi:hypothetical protein